MLKGCNDPTIKGIRGGIHAGLIALMACIALSVTDATQAAADCGDANNVINGTGGADTLVGRDDRRDEIKGFAGKDVLRGRALGDCLRGHDDGDELWGGDGVDELLAGDGVDELYGGIGSDVLQGGVGADYLSGSDGDDELSGGSAADVINCGLGWDVAHIDSSDTVNSDCESVTGLSAPVAAAPLAPQPYGLPAAPPAVVVSNGAQLASELAGTTPKDIILEDGTYDTGGGYFQAGSGHRLWARNLQGALLTAGLVFGGNSGAGGGEVHGLGFEVTDPNRAFDDGDSGMLFTWGVRGTDTKVYDTTFGGAPGSDHQIDAGIIMRRVEDAVVERVIVRDVKRWGLRLQAPGGAYDNPERVQTLRDVAVHNVAMPVPGSSGGTAEAGVWVGAPVVNAVERLTVEHAWWTGLWTGGSSKDTVFRDITVPVLDSPGAPNAPFASGTGIYAEHRSDRNVYERLSLGPSVVTGIRCEWKKDQGRGACDSSTFQNGVISSKTLGVHLDEGSAANVAQRLVFTGQSCAAILNYLGVGNAFSLNDYSGIDPGAISIRTSHHTSSPAC